MAKKTENKIDWKVICIAIIALCIIEIFAMMNGINGTFRMTITAIIAGLAGWTIPQFKKK